MKTSIRIFLTVIAAAFVASCAKEGEGVRVFRASAEQATENGKVVLRGSSLHWSAGNDTVSIYDAASNRGLYIANGTSSSATQGAVDEFSHLSGGMVSTPPYTAVYPASIRSGAAQVTLPEVQRSTDGSLQSLPMYAVSDNDKLKFYHLGGVVRLRLTASAATSLSSIAITTGSRTTGTASISGSGNTVSLGTPNGSTTTTLLIANAQSIASARDFYLSLPAGSHYPFVITLTAANGASCTKTANSAIAIERGKITPITLTGLVFTGGVPEGAIDGRFSVSATKQVYFAKGNLQYRASTGSWRFAPHQYDMIGDTNSRLSATYSGWTDLFGWGTSGWNSGATAYQPYASSSLFSHYYPGGAYTNSLTGSYARADWGVNNAIAGAGNAANKWRTPTHSEWHYLFYGRQGAASKWGYATVAGRTGIVVLPDSFSDPRRNNGSGAFRGSATTGFTANVYNAEGWEAMEQAGALFLPAAGYRDGTSVLQTASNGHYWSASHCDEYSSYRLSFAATCLGADGYDIRSNGFSVRLVYAD